MSGVAVIRYLLANNAPIVAIIPAARIMAGDLPLNMPLPAISVTQVSSVPRNTLQTNESPKVHTDRVQVTWFFNGTEATPAGTGYPGLRAMGRLLLAACPSQRGTINGVAVQAIIPDVEGPDFAAPDEALLSSSRDFLVRWIGT